MRQGRGGADDLVETGAELVVDVGSVGGEGFADDAVGDAARVAPAREHADEPAGRGGALLRGVGGDRAELALDQLPGPQLLRRRIHLGEGFLRHLVGHTLAAQLDGDRAAGQPAVAMPRAHPLARERGVVDQADLVEPLQHGVRGLIGHLALAEGLRELLPRAGPLGEQAQADLPRHGDGIGLDLAFGGRRLRAAPALGFHDRLARRPRPARCALDPSSTGSDGSDRSGRSAVRAATGALGVLRRPRPSARIGTTLARAWSGSAWVGVVGRRSPPLRTTPAEIRDRRRLALPRHRSERKHGNLGPRRAQLPEPSNPLTRRPLRPARLGRCDAAVQAGRPPCPATPLSRLRCRSWSGGSVKLAEVRDAVPRAGRGGWSGRVVGVAVRHRQKSTGAGRGSTSASSTAPMPSFSLIRFSTSAATSGFSRRNLRAFSLPCPIWSPS